MDSYELLEYFKESEIIKVSNLCKRMRKPKDLVCKALKKLEEEGVIYSLDDNCFMLIPSKYKISEIDMDSKKKSYIIIDGVQYSISMDDLGYALCFDKVLVEIIGNHKARVIKVIKREKNDIVCEVVSKNVDGKVVKYLSQYGTGNNFNIRIDKCDMKKLVDGQRVLVKISDEIVDDVVEAKYIKTIGHKSDPNIALQCIALNHGFNIDFSDEVKKEIDLIPTYVSEDEIIKVEDMRDDNFVTIDCSNTKDMDDAICIEKLSNGNFLIKIAIAHVSNYVKPNSYLFDEACKRGNSLYMLNTVLPMLPHELSNGICSLNPGEDRLARVGIFEVSCDGEVISSSFVKACIRSRKKMNYDDVNKILEDNLHVNGYEEYETFLKNAKDISNVFSEKRKLSGYLSFDNKEINIETSDDGDVKNIGIRYEKTAEKIIENFMILYNIEFINYLVNFGVDAVCRNHEIPDLTKFKNRLKLLNSIGYNINSICDITNQYAFQKILNSFSKYEEFSVLSDMLLRSTPKAYYTTSDDNKGHFALGGVEIYTHGTSPIRRMCDLLNHTLADYIEDYEKNFDNIIQFSKKLKILCDHISLTEREADKAEKEANNYAIVSYLKDYIGMQFDGYISDINRKYIKIKTTNYIDGVVPYDISKYRYDSINHSLKSKNGNEYKIGNKFSMIVKDVDLENNNVIFELVEKEKSKVKVLK